MENNRKKQHTDLEVVPVGFANGISTQLSELIKNGEHRSLNDGEKWKIVDEAEKAYGDFLDALGVDFQEHVPQHR